jgi:hypothetical protein
MFLATFVVAIDRKGLTLKKRPINLLPFAEN